MLVLYCSRIVAVCLHALQTLTALPAHTSCMPCQARVRWKHACLAAQAGVLGFSLCLRPAAQREPPDTWQRWSPSPLGGEVRSHMTRGSVGAHLSREARSGAVGHVAAPEPTSAERRGLEPEDTWQHRSPPQLGGEVQCCWTRGSAGAHLNWEVSSGAVGHVAAPEPTSIRSVHFF
jgi:hypothetical protein